MVVASVSAETRTMFQRPKLSSVQQPVEIRSRDPVVDEGSAAGANCFILPNKLEIATLAGV
ncbi:hypothetical protein BDA96_06G256500 [Sorghum bicolor]|uniref:Uncharacterized protein n=2 Tax=Sorghum bicolor TaxID=4558 RepID=A0A921UEQ0_SORBI|nr:hypothetical protein BDA96_06G256500 [Sorghum bicolor]OQU82417.1 hypothetical protein SORBI_3006G234466 [Sorghum bicolor]